MQLLSGLIIEHDPDRGYYRVQPEFRDQVLAVALNTGAVRPYPRYTRVLCADVERIGWVILGEVAQALATPDKSERPQTVEETVAQLRSEVLAAADPTGSLDNRPFLRAPHADPTFSGDVLLENRAADPRSRSQVRIFSFGAVLLKASEFCLQLFDARESQILVQARSLLTRAVGYLKTIVVRAEDPRTVIREQLQADYLNSERPKKKDAPPFVDRETIEGIIPAPDGKYAKDFEELATKPKAMRGLRVVQGAARVEEYDFHKSTARMRQDVVENRDADDAKRVFELAAASGDIDGEGTGSAKRGFRAWFRRWLQLEVDNEAQTATLTYLDGTQPYQVVIKKDRLLLERGGQFIRLDDDGLFIHAKNITLQADERTTQRSGQAHEVAAPRINHTKG